MTLISLEPGSLQFNLADQRKIEKKSEKILLDDEMVKILRYLIFEHVVIKNLIKYRNKNAIFFLRYQFRKKCFISLKILDYSS